jgi:hypothetical protein
MLINPKDAGAHLKVVGGGGARGVAAGTGDNTEVVGVIVDSTLEPGLVSGLIIVAGSATLTTAKSISILDLKIEHGDDSGLSDKADYTFGHTKNSVSDIKVSASGSTEPFAIKQKVDLTGLKRYWRVSCKPDLDAGSTDVFELGFCVAAIGEASPQADAE